MYAIISSDIYIWHVLYLGFPDNPTRPVEMQYEARVTGCVESSRGLAGTDSGECWRKTVP